MGLSLIPAVSSPFPLFNHMRQHTFRFRPTRILFFLILCSIFANIGVWHLNQSAIKTLKQLKEKEHFSKTISVDTLIEHYQDRDLSNYHLHALGKFDYLHSIKIPVKNNFGKGIELYVPFFIFGSEKLILVDRGFFSSLPSTLDAPPTFGQQEVHGILTKSFPTMIHLKMLGQYTHQHYYDYILHENSQIYPQSNQNTDATQNLIEKDTAYAMLWFMVSSLFFLLCFWGKKKNG